MMIRLPANKMMIRVTGKQFDDDVDDDDDDKATCKFKDDS